MIDNPAQVGRLLPKLMASVPVTARMTPELAATLRDRRGGADLPRDCQLTRIDYAGEEGGIMCKLEFGGEDEDEVIFASITHLRFGGRSPLAREIAAYQKHRVKRLQRL